MDWTGGAHRRFAQGKHNAVLQKQKAHFAKARALQQHQRSSQRLPKPDTWQQGSRTDNGSQPRNQPASRSPQVVVDKEASRGSRGDHQSSKPVASHTTVKRRTRSRSLTPRKRKLQASASSVVYISSTEQLSQSQSPVSQQDSARAKSKLRSATTYVVDMNDEEKLFLSKRRRLLARTDWLGLDRLRPLQIKFPSSCDKDRVGKRRKIKDSASTRDQAARKKLSAPPFQAPLSPGAHLMSGALQPGDIQIKIGTDALISQTQQSRHSRTPGKTSMRPPSTELGSLSEASMLLDAEENGFESTLLPAHTPNESDLAREHMERSVVSPERAGTPPLQYVPERPVMRSFQHEEELRLPGPGAQVQRRLSIETRAPFVPEFERSMIPESEMRGHVGLASIEQGVQADSTYNANRIFGAHQYASVGAVNEQGKQDEGEDEVWWQRWFGVKQYAPTQRSTVALKSSSLHDTTSDALDREQFLAQEPAQHLGDKSSSTPALENSDRGQHSQAMTGLRATRIEDPAAVPSAMSQSPSTSFKQFQRLVDLPAARTGQAEDDAQDEALWREFIIGSQGTSDDLLQPFPENTSQIEAARGLGEMSRDSSYPASGLGTSIKSTRGGTLFEESGTPGMDTSGSLRNYSEPLTTQHDTFKQRSSADGLQAATVSERDSIEDNDPDSPEGIYERYKKACEATSVLNPKRFKPPKREGSVKPRTSGFRRPTRGTRAPRKDRSVYDLVDSDGLSISG